MHRGSVPVLLLSWVIALAACVEDSVAPEVAGLSDSLEPSAIDEAITEVERVEELTETVANRIIGFSDAIKGRDFDRARAVLADDFKARGFANSTVSARKSLPLDTSRIEYSIQKNSSFHQPDEFIDELRTMLAPMRLIERVFFKTRGAEFEQNGERGLVRLTVEIVGADANDGPVALYGWAHGEVILRDGLWQLRRFILERYTSTTRDKTIFTNVAETAGLSVKLPRLGKDGNDDFYWRGAAIADVDGDGRFDIFTSTHDRVWLYRNAGNGRFEECAKASGLGMLPGGVTAPIFFDFDNDGDRDLFCSGVGWEEDGVPYGTSLKLFRNDGKGVFTDATEELGLDLQRACAFSATATDVNGDGWLDLYVCCYERLDALYPNSWFDATNGNPNLLLMNRGGREFEDCAPASGVAGSRWSYAVAAADFDDDGDQDLYVANDYGPNELFRNKGDGTFENVASELGVVDVGNGMGVTWGDLNADGRLDLYVSNMSSSAGNRILRRMARAEGSDVEKTLFKLAAGNTIFTQNEAGSFDAAPSSAGGISASWAWSPALLDIDLDGLLDVYVANGFISGDSLRDT